MGSREQTFKYAKGYAVMYLHVILTLNYCVTLAADQHSLVGANSVAKFASRAL